jgi:hypothetical protein
MRAIYHGTSESTARQALKRGILPRTSSRKGGNWKHTVSSNPSMVYLTDAYAAYFALSSTNIRRERPALIELDLDLLDQSRLYPDEDFIEQALRGRKLGESNDIKKRNRHIIRHIEDYRENWKLSLEKLGNLCFKGTVPARAITKVVLFEPKKNPAMAADSLNPTITLANYKFCGERYRAITRWFMGEDIDPATVAFGVQLPPDVIRQFSYATEAIEAAGRILQNRRGLKVIFQSKSLPVVSSV